MEDRRACSSIIVGALLPAMACSAVATAAFIAGRGQIGRILESPGVTTGMAWAAPGLFLFAANKVLLGAVNGLRWMRTFAALNALRPVTMVATFFLVWVCGLRGEALPVVFTAAEMAVFVGALSLLVGRGYLRLPAANVLHWARVHLAFGVRSFAGGMLVELNTRVDVLMLGYFAADDLVGVYSFAAMLAEGIHQLAVVVRNNYNPRLARHLAGNDMTGLRRVVRRGKLATYAIMLLLGAAAVSLYPLGVRLLGRADPFLAGWPLLATLVAGVVVASGYVPFGHILLMAGRPATHTLLTLLTITANVVGNALLIPLLWAQGAATATALAHVVNAVLLCVLTRLSLRLYL
jgi:O-antigen/teichoic acid export membrane protein